MKQKIMVVALGGTIGSTIGDSISLDSNNLKILDYYENDDIIFNTTSPYSVLSENTSIQNWEQLFHCLDSIDYSQYLGVIILHGSDTLAYTAAMVGNAYSHRSIVLVAADKPLEDDSSNGVANFSMAVEHLLTGASGVYVAYDRLMPALCVTSAGVDDHFLALDSTLPAVDSSDIYPKNILVVQPYVGMSAHSYDLDSVDAVLIGMYHSATVPPTAKELSSLAASRGIPCHYVTHRLSADYESAQDINNIIYGCTMENAYARLLLTKL